VSSLFFSSPQKLLKRNFLKFIRYFNVIVVTFAITQLQPTRYITNYAIDINVLIIVHLYRLAGMHNVQCIKYTFCEHVEILFTWNHLAKRQVICELHVAEHRDSIQVSSDIL